MRRLVLMSMLLIATTTQAGKINTATITTATIAAMPSCLKWQLRGTCFWLTCSWTGCKKVATPYVKHYLPDTIVTVFDRAGNNPWTEANLLFDKAGEAAAKQLTQSTTGLRYDAGFQSMSDTPADDTLQSFEVGVVGHPVVSLINQWSMSPLLRPATTSLSPYYQSMLDTVSWRRNPESLDPRSWVLLPKYMVGSMLNQWGLVYPRHGFVTNPNKTKAASVIALRAMDITARSRGLHIARPLSHDCGTSCDVKPFKINDGDTQFQMIYPERTSRCSTLGQQHDIKSHDNQYAWVVWRQYEGCVQHKGWFLYRVRW